jgi:hypothetical protein
MNKQQKNGINYDALKQQALTLEPVQKKVLLSQIEIDNNGSLSIGGRAIRADKDVVERQLLKILQLNPSFLKRFGKLTSEETKKDFINLLKNALTLQDVKKSEITLIGNPKTQIITNIMPGTQDFISNRIALEMFERTMNGLPDLRIVGFDNYEDGSFSINVIKGEPVSAEYREQTIKGEEFNPGYNFRNNPLKGSVVSSYVERKACDNGMIVRDHKGDFRIEKLEDGHIRKFFEGFTLMGQSNFIPGAFPELLDKAMHTPASFHEILTARNAMLNNSTIKLDKDLYDYLPEFRSSVNMLARKGHDYANCSDNQLKNLPTDYNVWDIVNRMTWFGSHDSGNNADFSKIQTSAGNLFKKDVYDTENVLILK